MQKSKSIQKNIKLLSKKEFGRILYKKKKGREEKNFILDSFPERRISKPRRKTTNKLTAFHDVSLSNGG